MPTMWIFSPIVHWEVPIAGFGKIQGDTIALHGLVADLDGTSICRDSQTGNVNLADSLAVTLAERLIAKGADKILEELKSNGQ